MSMKGILTGQHMTDDLSSVVLYILVAGEDIGLSDELYALGDEVTINAEHD